MKLEVNLKNLEGLNLIKYLETGYSQKPMHKARFIVLTKSPLLKITIKKEDINPMPINANTKEYCDYRVY